MTTNVTPRQQLITWEDPQIALVEMPKLSGFDYLQKIVAGELPSAPISSHMNLTLIEVGDGTVTFECLPDESHYNPIGMVHGGLVCTLLDSGLGCSVHTTLPAGIGYTSIELKTNFLRPISADTGRLICIGRVVKRGRRVAFAEAEVLDGDGKILATASGSVLVFPLD